LEGVVKRCDIRDVPVPTIGLFAGQPAKKGINTRSAEVPEGSEVITLFAGLLRSFDFAGGTFGAGVGEVAR
jgi:hypothetical protein